MSVIPVFQNKQENSQAPVNKWMMKLGILFQNRSESRLIWLGGVAIITGGADLLGCKHGEAVAEMRGLPILVDLDKTKVESAEENIKKKYGSEAWGGKQI